MIGLGQVDRLRKDWLDRHCSPPVHELRRAKILEPIFRAFDRVKFALPIVCCRHYGRLGSYGGHVAVLIDRKDRRIRAVQNPKTAGFVIVVVQVDLDSVVAEQEQVAAGIGGVGGDTPIVGAIAAPTQDEVCRRVVATTGVQTGAACRAVDKATTVM